MSADVCSMILFGGICAFPRLLYATSPYFQVRCSSVLCAAAFSRREHRGARAERRRGANDAYDFSEYKKLKPTHKVPGKLTLKETKFLEWFIGFTEGDGSFYLKENKLIFVINQADLAVLKKIRTTLGFGVVTTYQQNDRIYASYRVCGTDKIKKLIAIFNGNIHLEKVFNRFEVWVQKFNSYAADLEHPITLKPRRSPLEITLESEWLSGFFDAEGGFSAGISDVKKVKTSSNTQSPPSPLGEGKKRMYNQGEKKPLLRLRITAYVDQKFEYEVMDRIRQLFDVKSVTVRNAEKQFYRIEVTKKKSLDILIKYFQQHPLCSKKHITYAMWKKVVNLYLKNAHREKIADLRPQVERIQQQNHEFKTEKSVFKLSNHNL